MIQAHLANQTGPEYVYVIPSDIRRITNVQPWIDATDGSRDQIARKAYEAALIVKFPQVLLIVF